jgi:hypothetical protein
MYSSNQLKNRLLMTGILNTQLFPPDGSGMEPSGDLLLSPSVLLLEMDMDKNRATSGGLDVRNRHRTWDSEP